MTPGLTAQSTPSPHVLVVEDDRETRDLVTRFLKQNGYRVTAVPDGRMMRKVIAQPQHPAHHHGYRQGRGNRPYRRPGGRGR